MNILFLLKCFSLYLDSLNHKPPEGVTVETVHGLFINKRHSNLEELRELIANLDYTALDRKSLQYRNTRNAIYDIKGHAGKDLYILKRSRPSPNYTIDRVISFYLRNFFKHYGRSAFRGALILQQHQIPTIEPVAYWKIRVGFFRYQSCFLYRKLEADYSVRGFLENQYREGNAEHKQRKEELLNQMCELIRSIHSQGLRHLDLIINNFLVKEGPSERKLFVIDTDHVRYNIVPTKFLKRFMALRCLCRMNFSEEEQQSFLKRYLQNEYRHHWFQVLQFWQWWDRRPLRKIRGWFKNRILTLSANDDLKSSALHS